MGTTRQDSEVTLRWAETLGGRWEGASTFCMSICGQRAECDNLSTSTASLAWPSPR